MPKFYDIPELFMVVRFYEDTQQISIRRYSRFDSISYTVKAEDDAFTVATNMLRNPEAIEYRSFQYREEILHDFLLWSQNNLYTMFSAEAMELMYEFQHALNVLGMVFEEEELED